MSFLTKSRTRLLAALFALGLAATSAHAGLVVIRFGSQDGFGIGVASGAAFDFGDLTAPTAQGTDEVVEGGFTTALDARWSGTLVSAQVEVFSGGWGLYGAAELVLNGTVLGKLSVGDFDLLGANYAFLDTLGIDALNGGLINGLNQFSIRVVEPGSAADPLDAGVLGFIRLTLQTQDAGTGNTVPEPASLALAGLALVAALAARRRRA